LFLNREYASVFCWGELLLRLSPALRGEWIREANMPVYVGGAELNVAQALANWKVPVAYGTAIPDHYLSQEIIQHIAGKNVDTSSIVLKEGRIGAYYLPTGADLKNAAVIYDRADSSFARLKPGELDWKSLLKGKSWFHCSAISPALNADAAAVCLEAVREARQLGLTVSIDLNYRARLWQYGKKPTEIMPALLEHCDVVMGNAWAAESLLGISSPVADSRGLSDAELEAAAYESMNAVQKQFPQVSSLAYTYRLEKEYWAVIRKGKEQGRSRAFAMGDAVDRVGSGDCFMGGLIYGLIHDHAADDIINFAAAAAVGKLYEKGDATRQSVEDVLRRLQTGTINK
jgi:2-dehydro-3-deoxygluconokinase